MKKHSFIHDGGKLNHAKLKEDGLRGLSGEQLRQLQLCLLGVYADIKHACDKFNISIYAVYGTALGAVRHKGFIPWDDDLDIAMTRDDYCKFREIFEQELSGKYVLNAPNYCDNARTRFPKVMLKNSCLRKNVDTKDASLHRVFVDIFIIENIPDNRLLRIIKGCWCNILEWISGQVYAYECIDEGAKSYLYIKNKWSYYIKMVTGFIFSFMSAYRWNDVIDRSVQWPDVNTKQCGLPTGRGHYFGEVIDRKRLLPGKEGAFEGESVLLFQDWDFYLRNLYGDYMKIPPEGERKSHGIVELKFPEEV